MTGDTNADLSKAAHEEAQITRAKIAISVAAFAGIAFMAATHGNPAGLGVFLLTMWIALWALGYFRKYKGPSAASATTALALR